MNQYSFTDSPQEAAEQVLMWVQTANREMLDERLMNREINRFMREHGEQFGYAGIVKARFKRQIEALVREQYPKEFPEPPEDWEHEDFELED